MSLYLISVWLLFCRLARFCVIYEPKWIAALTVMNRLPTTYRQFSEIKTHKKHSTHNHQKPDNKVVADRNKRKIKSRARLLDVCLKDGFSHGLLNEGDDREIAHATGDLKKAALC